MGDLIDRQAAIAVADFSDYAGLSVDDVKKVTDEVVKGLKLLPSAQPEPPEDICDECDAWNKYKMKKTGYWIFSDECVFGNPYGHYRCPVCGGMFAHTTNYCPDCGAILYKQRSDVNA